MGKLLLELSNSNHWIPLWSYRLEAGQVWGLQKAIPEQTIPVLLDQRILAAKATSLSGSPTWKYGGLLKPLLQVASGHFTETLIKSHRLSLNETKLIFLDDLGEYKLKIAPPKWFPSFELDLWSYIGPVEDTGEYVRGRIRRFYTYTPNPVATLVLPRRIERSSATLYNSSDAVLYVGFNPNLTELSSPETLYPGGQWVSDGGDIGDIWIVSDRVSNKSLQIVEYSQS